MSEHLSRVFLDGMSQLGFYEDDVQLAHLLRYRQELLDWNTRVNLTAITDSEEVLLRHFLDSLSLLTVLRDREEVRLLDIGSGAGFPGLPLKIVRPGWSVTLLEATGKKVKFLEHMVAMLQLNDVVVIHGRAEELAQKQLYRAAFDVVTARAVAALPILLEYCAPYCCIGGQIILPKKGELVEELVQGKRAAEKLGAVFKADTPVTLPGLHDGRRLLVWTQEKLCPPTFPRSGSAMTKRSLGS